MGVDTESELLTWDQIKPHVDKLNSAALEQLIDTWQATKDNTSDGVYWGDEVEYQIIKIHSDSKEAHLCLQQSDILRKADSADSTTTYEWQPEFARFMAESNPTKPYTVRLEELAGVATSMRKRRKELKSLLVDDADPFTLTLFPLLGSQHNKFDHNEESQTTTNETSRFVPDNIISPKKRYTFLESNARARSNKPMVMKVPIFVDVETPSPWRDPTLDTSHVADGNIFLEGTIFGPGACGLQVTMEARNRQEAYEIHDQLCALGPVMLALTANTPIFKGFLANTDARWNTISESFDDRTPDEMASIAPRWSPCPMYLSPSCPDDLCNSTVPADMSIRKRLESVGVEPPLAHLYANFFMRSILLVNEDDLADPTIRADPDLWTRLSGTIFPHVRLKMPQHSEGWRVEFRPMEVQFTDFDNASCAIFVTLFRQAVARYNLDFRLPIETVHKDIDKAHVRDACTKSHFWWRRMRSISNGSSTAFVTDKDPALCTIHEIMNGSWEETQASGNPGLLHLVKTFVTESDASRESDHNEPHYLSTLDEHLNFISGRASGKLPTGAHFTRNLVRNHQDYQHDSVVTSSICYELVKQVKSMMDADAMSGLK